MPLAIVALVTEILGLIPSIASAGISIAGLVSNVRSVLDANSAPDDPTWQALDATTKGLQAQLAQDPPAAS